MSFLGGTPSPFGLSNRPVPVADQPSSFDLASQQYPILKKLGIQFKSSIGQGKSGNLLEFWKPGEPGDKSSPRPGDIPLKSPGVEVFSDKVRPIDILGDVVSHHLMETDPKIKKTYDVFEKSLTPRQESVLQHQYEYAQQNQDEKRPFDEWRKETGLPAMFRGYAFQQWPDEFNQKVYTPEQIKLFDTMMQYLQGQK